MAVRSERDRRSANGEETVSRDRPTTSSRFRKNTGPSEPLENGQKVRDSRQGLVGEVVDHACQYSHPKADPVYSYLVRWEDGQVQAISEGALGRGAGIELID